MIKAESLSKSYGSHLLFKNVSFQLEKRERCCLVGRNGCGKSSLLKILIGIESPDTGLVSIPKNYQIGYLEQHIQFTQPTLIKETALSLPIEERETPYRAESILCGLGFAEEDFVKPPSSFSGGYQLRIQLTKTLAREPDCLLLDEPTNYLDIASIRWLEKFLRDWKGELIAISHDRVFLDSISTHTMGIHRQALCRIKGTTRSYYDYLIQKEESQEKERIKIEKKKIHAESYIKRFGAKATKAKQAQSRKKTIDKLPSLEKLAQIENLNFSFQSAPFPGHTMLEASDLSFSYENMEQTLITDFNLEIGSNDRIAIIGKNGRGKSTLLKLLADELKPLKGNIKRSDNLEIGYFGQTNIANLNPSLTIEQEIAASNKELPFGEIKRICAMMMFSQKQSEKKICILSGGEKSRVLLGKILAAKCNLLLLDEPTSHLDLESVEALIEAMETFHGSVVIVSHTEEILYRIPETFIICNEAGQEVFKGGYTYFLEKKGWEEDKISKNNYSKNSRKESKQQRAEKVQARAKALKPIKKQIEKIEQEIEVKEHNLSLLHQRLQGNPEKIVEISKSIGIIQRQVDELFSTLESLYTQHEQIMLSFAID